MDEKSIQGVKVSVKTFQKYESNSENLYGKLKDRVLIIATTKNSIRWQQ